MCGEEYPAKHGNGGYNGDIKHHLRKVRGFGGQHRVNKLAECGSNGIRQRGDGRRRDAAFGGEPEIAVMRRCAEDKWLAEPDHNLAKHCDVEGLRFGSCIADPVSGQEQERGQEKCWFYGETSEEVDHSSKPCQQGSRRGYRETYGVATIYANNITVLSQLTGESDLRLNHATVRFATGAKVSQPQETTIFMMISITRPNHRRL